MKLKQAGYVGSLDGRIDGIMFGPSSGTTVGVVWPYPLGSPSFLFLTVNDTIRQLDVKYETLSVGKKSEWELFFDGDIKRAMCLLFHFLFGSMTPAEGGKSAYVNANMYRALMNTEQSNNVPLNNLVQTDDHVVMNPDPPFRFTWFRTGPDNPFPMQMVLWAKVLNTKPAGDVPHRKMKYFGIQPMQFNQETNIQGLINEFVSKWPGAFVQVAVAACPVGSVPYAAFQMGQYQ